MNVEQSREVSHAAHDSLFAMMNSCRCHTQLYARLWKYLSSYSKLVDLCVCVDFVFVVLEVESMVVFRDEGTFEPTAEMLSREAGPIRWQRRSCEFTVLDIFWSNVTECICIWSFRILLIEGLTEIEYVLRPVHFWNSTQHEVVIPFHLFGITNRSHLQGSRCPRSTQPAHTGCLLEELTYCGFIVVADYWERHSLV